MNRYFDHAATSFPKAPGVIPAMSSFLENEAGNPGRGGHRLTLAASRAVERARSAVALLLGGEPERTLFGAGATYWLNSIFKGTLSKGDRVVTSAIEHNAVMRPLRELEERRQIEVVTVDGADADGVPTAAEIRAAVDRAPTRLVVLTHASNVSGAVLPVTDIVTAVAPVPVIVDGAQSAGSMAIDFQKLGAAAFVCSGHKGLLGPPGVGVALLAPDFDLHPLVSGGTGSRSESEFMPTVLPDRFEAGTPNTVGIVGLGAACEWLSSQPAGEIATHGRRRLEQLADGLQGCPAIEFVGRNSDHPRVAILSFRCHGVDNGELAARLDREHQLMLRAGLHCAPAAHRRLGSFPNGALRAGIGPFTSDVDVDALITAINHELTVSAGRTRST